MAAEDDNCFPLPPTLKPKFLQLEQLDRILDKRVDHFSRALERLKKNPLDQHIVDMISAQVELLLVQEDVALWVQEHAPEIQAMAEWDGIHCKDTDDVWAVYLLQKHCNMSKKALIYYEEDCLGHMAAVAVPLRQNKRIRLHRMPKYTKETELERDSKRARIDYTWRDCKDR